MDLAMGSEIPAARPPRARLFRIALIYLLPCAVFAMVAWAGLRALGADLGEVGVPWTTAGLGGAVGSAAIIASAFRGARSEVTAANLVAVSRLARGVMLLAAAGSAVAAVRLAPDGVDRVFTIGVDLGLSVALMLFALTANHLERAPHRAGRRGRSQGSRPAP